MTTDSLTAKLNELKTLLTSVQQFISVYEGQIENKAAELKNIEHRLAAIREEHKGEQSKSGAVLAKASEEAAAMRQEAREMLEKARERESILKGLQDQANAAIAEAKERSRKLQLDEQAHHNAVVVFERKKAALEAALGK